jgi:hypothetical protein
MSGVSEPPPYPPPPDEPYPYLPPDQPYSAPPPPEQPFLPPHGQPYSAPPPPEQPFLPPHGQPYDPYSPQPATTTNGFAIASLVLGILGPCGLLIGLILAIVFGFIGLSQTKDGRQKGRGMAIAGLILSGLWIVGLVVTAVLVAVFNHDVRPRDLKVGDCIENTPAKSGNSNITNITTLPKVSCDKPHQGEVYAILNIPGDRFPGMSVLESQYQPQCASALVDYAKNPTDLEVFAIFPSQETWDQGHHDVVCLTLTSDKRTGSVKK